MSHTDSETLAPTQWDDASAWNLYFAAQLSAGHPAPWPSPIVLRFLSFARGKGGRVWFPGCGIDAYPLTYAERGCQVTATDFSSVAVDYQRRLAEAFLTKTGSGEEPGAFVVAAKDFTSVHPDGTFDVVVNVRAFQGLATRDMRDAAAHFHAALRAGGTAIIDTMNLQGDGRTVVEDSLLAAGFYIPYLATERWYRQTLDGTGIVYGMLLGRPRIPNRNQYPPQQFSELADHDQQILDTFRVEYEQRRHDEADDVTAMVDDPRTVVAHVVYATG